jgi:hypothetical protein
MILSAHQPYFAPYGGFFAKAHHCDCLVLMDAVQFPRGKTWLTRNRFKHDQGDLWLSVPVWKKGLGFQRIDRVRISHEGRWARKHLDGLKSAYGNAPFFEEHLGFLEDLHKEKPEELVDFNLAIIRYGLDQLRISSRVIRLSDLGLEMGEPRLSVEICRKLGASSFLAQVSARRFLEEALFRQAGIELRFLSYRPPVYPQLWGPFLPNLSFFDLLFSCGPKGGEILKRHSRILPGASG